MEHFSLRWARANLFGRVCQVGCFGHDCPVMVHRLFVMVRRLVYLVLGLFYGRSFLVVCWTFIVIDLSTASVRWLLRRRLHCRWPATRPPLTASVSWTCWYGLLCWTILRHLPFDVQPHLGLFRFFSGPQTLLMVRRLFLWSADSFMGQPWLIPSFSQATCWALD